jgi:hypothetical protein
MYSKQALLEFDGKIDDTIFRLLGDDVTGDLDNVGYEEQIALLRALPMAQGGLGLHRYSGLAGEVACVESRGLVARFLCAELPHLADAALRWWAPIQIGASESTRLQVGFDMAPPTDEHFLVSQRETDGPLSRVIPADEFEKLEAGLQRLANDGRDAKKIAAAIQGRRSVELVQWLESGGKRELAQWLQSSKFRGSGRWLGGQSHILYGPFAFTTDEEYTMALRLRMLLPPLHSSKTGELIACSCGAAVDYQSRTFHALDCTRRAVRFEKQRHDLVRDAVAKYLRASVTNTGCVVATEALVPPVVTTPAAGGGGGITGGVEVTVDDGDVVGNNGGAAVAAAAAAVAVAAVKMDITVVGGLRRQCIDVAVVNPCAPHYLLQQTTHINIQDTSKVIYCFN